MSIVKYVAYGVGGTTLLAGSFFLVTALSGTPMNAMKGVGGLFPPEPKATLDAPSKLPEPEVQLENDTRSKQQVFDAARSPLTAFILQDPFSAQELGTLENRLKLKLEELDKRAKALDEREALLERDTEHLERQFLELDRLKSSLLSESDEQRALSDEIKANNTALAAREAAVYKQMAFLFDDGEPADTAAQLVDSYQPDKAAKILKNLTDDRAREILTAMNPDVRKGYMQAYAVEKAN